MKHECHFQYEKDALNALLFLNDYITPELNISGTKIIFRTNQELHTYLQIRIIRNTNAYKTRFNMKELS